MPSVLTGDRGEVGVSDGGGVVGRVAGDERSALVLAAVLALALRTGSLSVAIDNAFVAERAVPTRAEGTGGTG